MTARTSQWAIVNSSGMSITNITSLISVEVRDSAQVVSESIEQGSFASYNKVVAPFDIYVSVAVQGEPDELQRTIDDLRAAKAGTELYSLITPEQEYEDLCIESMDYKRTREDGINALYVELHMVEVRQVDSQYTSVSAAALRAAQCKNSDNASKTEQGKKKPSAMVVIGRKAEDFFSGGNKDAKN